MGNEVAALFNFHPKANLSRDDFMIIPARLPLISLWRRVTYKSFQQSSNKYDRGGVERLEGGSGSLGQTCWVSIAYEVIVIRPCYLSPSSSLPSVASLSLSRAVSIAAADSFCFLPLSLSFYSHSPYTSLSLSASVNLFPADISSCKSP